MDQTQGSIQKYWFSKACDRCGPLSAVCPDGAGCSGHREVASRGILSSLSPPLLTPELELWMNRRHSSSAVNPSIRLLSTSLPCCSGRCSNAITPHLGLAKPVLTMARREVWHVVPCALTPDGNTMAQGLAGWLVQVQIMLLIVQRSKQLPGTMTNRQSSDCWKYLSLSSHTFSPTHSVRAHSHTQVLTIPYPHTHTFYLGYFDSSLESSVLMKPRCSSLIEMTWKPPA